MWCALLYIGYCIVISADHSVQTQPKEIANLSNTPLAAAGTQEAVVGEEIRIIALTTSLPVALFAIS